MNKTVKIVVFWRSGGRQVRELAGRLPEVEFVFVESEEGLAGEIADADAFVLSGLEYTPGVPKLLDERAKRLRWMQATSAGIDRFIKHGVPSGIAFTRGGGLWDKPVAEHAMAMILTFARKILYIDRLQRTKEWAKWPVDSAIRTLEGKTLGILGYGGIGKEVARRAKAFDTRVWGLGRRLAPETDALLDRRLDTSGLEELLHASDFLVISLPLTQHTWHLIGDSELRLMKPTAVLINIARGGIVDEAALTKALEDGHLAGAALDAYELEPLPADHPFWGMENVIVSPHVAGATELRVTKCMALLETNIRRFLEGRPLLYPVDLDAGY